MLILWGIVEIVLLWTMADLASKRVSIRPLLVTLLGANIGHMVLALRYFFAAPAVFDGLVSMVLVAALFKTYRIRP